MIVQLLLMVLVVLFLKVDWLNKFLETLWPFLDKVSILRQVNVLIACKGLPSSLKILNFLFQAVCNIAKEVTKPIIAENTAKYKIDSVESETLTLGSLPLTFQGEFVVVTRPNPFFI